MRVGKTQFSKSMKLLNVKSVQTFPQLSPQTSKKTQNNNNKNGDSLQQANDQWRR